MSLRPSPISPPHQTLGLDEKKARAIEIVSQFLVDLTYPRLIVLVTCFAIALSEIVSSVVSLIFIGSVPQVIILAGFITPLVVAPCASFLLISMISHLKHETGERRMAQQAHKIARQDAAAAVAVKTDFLANVSHELRSPLNSIIGFSDILINPKKGTCNNPLHMECGQIIHDSGHHLLEVVNDILDVSRIESGKMELNEAPVELPKLGQTCLNMVKERARARGLSLFLEAGEDLPPIMADELKLRQIILNLLTNSIKFTKKGGTITLRMTADQDDGVVITVRDTGIGIAPKDVPRAFAKFTQLDNSHSRQQNGTGLGLPLSNALAKMHQGSLAIDSLVDEGTVVALNLPPSRILKDPPETNDG